MNPETGAMTAMDQDALQSFVEARAAELGIALEKSRADRWVSYRLEGRREHAIQVRDDGPGPCLAPCLSPEDWEGLRAGVESTPGYSLVERSDLPEKGRGWVRPHLSVPEQPGPLLEQLVDKALLRATSDHGRASPPPASTSLDQIMATITAAFGAGGVAVVGVVVLFFFICCCVPCCLPEPVPVPLPEKWTRQLFSSEGWVVQLETNEPGELSHVTRVGERLSWDGIGGHRLEAAATTAGDGHLGADEYARRSFDGERYEVGIDKCTPFLGGRPRKHSPDAPLSLALRDDVLYLEIEGCEGWSGPLFRPDQVDLVDTDGDGIPSAQECAWDDASIAKADRAWDRDCDGVPDDVDCDPANSSTSSRRDEDADCDGLIDAEDCDPRGEKGFVEDRDCDGMPDAQDCAPEDASNSSSREDDQDCDGISNGEDCAPEDATNATVGCQLPWVAQLDQACFDFDEAANDIQRGEAVRRGRKLTEKARAVGRGTLYELTSANAEATHVKGTFRIQDHYFETMVLKGSASYGVLADLTEGECAEFTISDLTIDAWLDRSRVCRTLAGNRTFSGRLVRLSECASPPSTTPKAKPSTVKSTPKKASSPKTESVSDCHGPCSLEECLSIQGRYTCSEWKCIRRSCTGCTGDGLVEFNGDFQACMRAFDKCTAGCQQ